MTPMPATSKDTAPMRLTIVVIVPKTTPMPWVNCDLSKLWYCSSGRFRMVRMALMTAVSAAGDIARAFNHETCRKDAIPMHVALHVGRPWKSHLARKVCIDESAAWLLQHADHNEPIGTGINARARGIASVGEKTHVGVVLKHHNVSRGIDVVLIDVSAVQQRQICERDRALRGERRYRPRWCPELIKSLTNASGIASLNSGTASRNAGRSDKRNSADGKSDCC